MTLMYRSDDGRFAIRLGPAVVEQLSRMCLAAGSNETGGILVGCYSRNLAVAEVTAVSGPPTDSRAGRTWFERGVRGVGDWLVRLWRQKRYYLGEWHFHPSAAPDPSGTDVEQMRKIASSDGYQCPEPLLVIVGGDGTEGFRYRTFVYPRGGCLTELHPVPDPMVP